MEDYHSIKTIDEALSRTINLLWPPSPGVWLRIALIALFLGGGMTSPLRTEDLGISDLNTSEILAQSASPSYLNIFLSIGGGLLVACLLYVILSAILQFVFVDCLSSGEILLTRTFRLRLRKGFEIMLFYFLLLAIIIVATILLTLFIIIPKFYSGIPDLVTVLISVIQTLILMLIVLIPVWISAILVSDFIVPIMILDECGIIPAAHTFFSLFTGRWREAGIYCGLKIFLVFTLGIVIGIITFVVSIPLGIMDLIFLHNPGLMPVFSHETMIRIGFETAAVTLITLLLLVPLITFFRYYSLAILRELDPSHNLLPPI